MSDDHLQIIRHIVGLTGFAGAGKTTFLRLVRAAFSEVGVSTTSLSLSDVLRRFTPRRDAPVSREALIELARTLRRQHGPAALVHVAWPQIAARLHRGAKQPLYVIVDSIRRSEEVEELRRRHREGLTLVAVIADPTTRISRLAAALNRREGIAKSQAVAGARRTIRREKSFERSGRYNVEDCIAMADVVVVNDITRALLRQEARRVVAHLTRQRGLKRGGH